MSAFKVRVLSFLVFGIVGIIMMFSDSPLIVVSNDAFFDVGTFLFSLSGIGLIIAILVHGPRQK